MLSARNRRLSTPLMLCITQDKIELFIYLLYTFHHYFCAQGLDAIDIDGNSLLHLAALNHTHNNGIRFAKILMSFSPDHFKYMVNLKNNDGNTPLYLAVSNRNQKMMQFLMNNKV